MISTFTNKVNALTEQDPTKLLQQIINLSKEYTVDEETAHSYWREKIKKAIVSPEKMKEKVARKEGFPVSVHSKICANDRCPQYRNHQPADKFYRDKRSTDGLRTWCKECFLREVKDSKKRRGAG